MAKQVDTTYGNALFELALEEDRLDSLYGEAQGLLTVLSDNQDLIKLLSHPHISKEDKKKVVKDTFDGRVSDELTGLMCMAVEKEHATDIEAILAYFIKLVKNEKNIGIVSVTSAVSLTDSQRAAIEKRLTETTKYESFEAEYKVDKSLIGGLVIRIEDRVVDSSIKSQIDKLSKALQQ